MVFWRNVLLKIVFASILIFFTGNWKCSAQSFETTTNQSNATSLQNQFDLFLKKAEENRLKGESEIALEYAKKALQLSKTSKAIQNKANVYNELGEIHKSRMELDEALKNYLKASELFESDKNKSGVGIEQNNIGEVYRLMRNYKKAIECFNNSLRISYLDNDGFMIASSETNLGNTLYDIGNLKKSLSHFKNALNYCQQTKDHSSAALIQNNIGSINTELGQYDDAIANYKGAMAYFYATKDNSNYAMCLANIGNVYNVSGNYAQGIAYSQRALKIARSLNDKNLIASCYIFLAEGYQFSGNYKQAFDYQTKLVNLKDTLYDLQANQNVAEMQTKFDTEKKEKQNQILKQKNELQNLNLNRQRIINYSVTFGLLLVIGLAFFIFKGSKQKQRANNLLEEKNALVEAQKSLIEEKHKEITDSINYAERIQRSFLASKELLDENLADYFVFFQPKEVVSGDFYWATKLKNNHFLMATADSTGHGVPGAIMSLLNISSLEKAVEDSLEPSKILNQTRSTIIERLKKDGSEEGGKDGMDCCLISYNFSANQLTFAASNNPLWIVRQNEILEFAFDKMPVGKHHNDTISFSQQTIDLQKGDIVYTFTDGMVDQFGGPKGKKFMFKQLKELLLANSNLSMSDQKIALSNALTNWKGDLEQVDDITLIGVKI